MVDGMPRYKCHKEVSAIKIVDILSHTSSDRTTIQPEDPISTFEVSPEWMKKHGPKVGGYYVVYEDGYSSYSPPKAFEDGYTRI